MKLYLVKEENTIPATVVGIADSDVEAVKIAAEYLVQVQASVHHSVGIYRHETNVYPVCGEYFGSYNLFRGFAYNPSPEECLTEEEFTVDPEKDFFDPADEEIYI